MADADWDNALFLYGLRNCTIRNDSPELMTIPVHEAYLELSGGEQVSIRTVAQEWVR